MRYAVFFIMALISLSLISGCSGKKQTPTAAPNAEVTYDEGADLTGVLKEVYADGEMVSFFNPVTETEETFLYSSATSIQSPGGMELTMDQVSPGEVFDLYLDDTGHKLDMMAMKSDIIEAEETRLSVDPDAHIMTVDGVNYRYSDACVVLSDDKQIDPMEITSMDEVTFRGTKGLVYSVIVTRGHGYLQPMEYTDFVGGTVTIEGESILPVTEGMLITVPEGRLSLTMKNGDLISKTSATIKRNKVSQVNIKENATGLPNTSRVTFHVHPEGAELYINGQMVDYSKPVPLYYGRHSVKAVLEGYNNYNGIIRIQDPEPVIRIDLAEEIAAVEDDEGYTDGEGTASESTVDDDDGTVQNPSDVDYDVDHKITVSAPDGASVYINGTYKGVVPCSFVKCLGQITVTLQREGYETKSYSMEIIDDSEDTTLSFPDLNTSD